MTSPGIPLYKEPPATAWQRQALESSVVRFAGDSGDGIQLLGNRFAATNARAGNDLATFPDFPAEIRAPVGTTFGVSAFQINFGARHIKTSGDTPDVLVALNPAALKVELPNLKQGGLLIVDTGSFGERNLRKAGYASNPLQDGSLGGRPVIAIDISHLTMQSVKAFGLSQADALRCKNMWVLGLLHWMFDRNHDASAEWIRRKFAKDQRLADANIAALAAGHAYGETAELQAPLPGFHVPPAPLAAGVYRSVTGGEAMAWGLVAGAHLAGLDPFFASYPITPASPVLHALAGMADLGVKTLQAEDEIAAVCAAIGGSFAGALGITSSSGPGLALKAEAIGLAVSAELPLIVIDTQRAGPSTGMPTKTEQTDLNLALYGRHGESPLPVLAARSPADCFEVAIEAARLAVEAMTPVIVLSDSYIANASQAWRLPEMSTFTPFPAHFHTDPADFQPYQRDPETLSRPWAIPGTPGLAHRIGGLERDYETGNISCDAANHQKMTAIRAAKIARLAERIPEQTIELGDDHGHLALVGWGSSWGPISRAVTSLREQGVRVSHIHVRYLNPLPRNLGDLLRRFERLLVVEANSGQLLQLLRATYLIDAEGLNKVAGKPFTIEEVERAIKARL